MCKKNFPESYEDLEKKRKAAKERRGKSKKQATIPCLKKDEKFEHGEYSKWPYFVGFLGGEEIAEDSRLHIHQSIRRGENVDRRNACHVRSTAEEGGGEVFGTEIARLQKIEVCRVAEATPATSD